MPRVIILDTFPLSSTAKAELEPGSSPTVLDQCHQLQTFFHATPDRILSITDAHLEVGAKLWASARNLGKPTASIEALDADVILAAQAHSLGLEQNEFVIPMTNVGHLSQFVPADQWMKIRL